MCRDRLHLLILYLMPSFATHTLSLKNWTLLYTSNGLSFWQHVIPLTIALHIILCTDLPLSIIHNLVHIIEGYHFLVYFQQLVIIDLQIPPMYLLTIRCDGLTLGFFTPARSCPFSSIILNTGMGFELLGVLASAITLV